MIQHPDIYEALEARRRAAALHLFDPDVRLVDVGWRIVESESRIDRKSLRVRVHRRHKPRGAAFEAFAARQPNRVVDESKVGFPVDIVEAPYRVQTSFQFPFPTLTPPTAPPASTAPQVEEILPRTRRYRPLRGGVSGDQQYGTAATLGGYVRDRNTGAAMVLSNFHVLAGSIYALPGLPTVQPSSMDSPWFSYPVAKLTRHAMNDSLDAAVATLDPGIQFVNNQVGIGPVTGLGEPDLNMVVTKSGRTTGVTSGNITGFEGEGVLLNYGGFPTVIRNVWHIEAGGNRTSAGGDSGSWWLNRQTRQVVGLHFAGYHGSDADYALMLTMSKVLDSLQVNLAL